jgi:hypothetical protein
MLLDEEKGLLPVEVNYSAAIAPNAVGKPYWVADGQVTVQQRLAFSGRQDAEEAARFWSQPRRFFVPAFASTLEALLTQGVNLLLQPPALQPGPPARFEPATLPAADFRPTAEFVVMAVEAGRKDKLKKVDFNLQLSAPVLWILP